MKRSTVLAAVAAAVAVPRAVFAKPMPAFAPNSYMAAIQKRGTLYVGVKPDILGVGYQNPMTGKFEGFTVDLGENLSEAIFGAGGHVTYRPTEASTRVAMLQQGVIDVDIETMFITRQRSQQVAFAEPYWGAPTYIFVKKDNNTIRDMSDLAGKRVAATKGSSTEKAFEDPQSGRQKVNLLLLDSIAEVVDAVRIGRADAAVFDEVFGLAAIKASPDFKFVGPPVTYDYYGIALAKGHPASLAFVNQWLRRIKTDGTWARLYKKNRGFRSCSG